MSVQPPCAWEHPQPGGGGGDNENVCKSKFTGRKEHKICAFLGWFAFTYQLQNFVSSSQWECLRRSLQSLVRSFKYDVDTFNVGQEYILRRSFVGMQWWQGKTNMSIQDPATWHHSHGFLRRIVWLVCDNSVCDTSLMSCKMRRDRDFTQKGSHEIKIMSVIKSGSPRDVWNLMSREIISARQKTSQCVMSLIFFLKYVNA